MVRIIGCLFRRRDIAKKGVEKEEGGKDRRMWHPFANKMTTSFLDAFSLHHPQTYMMMRDELNVFILKVSLYTKGHIPWGH